jgi:peptidoglycan/xylan/chitin deacetylase (PgdA/CDA1 family)
MRMKKDVMTVVQCWDDGVTTDVRLVDILRRHHAPATFNLNADLHGKERAFGWFHQDTEVWRLGLDEMKTLYEGFTIANHSLTHPWLDRIDAGSARREITEGRLRLQDLFGQPVLGFAYPFGSYNGMVMDLVREAGHVYGRTTENADPAFPPADPMAFHPSCHFLMPDFWTRYGKAREGGVFYFWGHSYEMVSEAMWEAFESAIRKISADPLARWGKPGDLFG